MAGASPDFDTFKEAPGRKTYNRHVLTGSVCGNLLNQLFLSDSNIKIIQNAIRYKVYEKSNGKLVISNQDETELVITMRAVYLEYGRNTPDDVKGQIAELNQKVLELVVPGIIGQAYGYQQYLIDATTRPVPIARPSNVSSSGTKTLRSVTSVFA